MTCSATRTRWSAPTSGQVTSESLQSWRLDRSGSTSPLGGETLRPRSAPNTRNCVRASRLNSAFWRTKTRCASRAAAPCSPQTVTTTATHGARPWGAGAARRSDGRSSSRGDGEALGARRSSRTEERAAADAVAIYRRETDHRSCQPEGEVVPSVLRGSQRVGSAEIRLITNAASAAGSSVVDEIVAALDDLVQDPRWEGLMHIRDVSFH